MPATKPSKKGSASKKKDKGKGEATSSKDKPRRSKDKASSKEKASSGSEATAAAAAAAAPAVAADPDAVLLFRRYDCSRAGFLARTDFLQLVRDYASAPNDRWASRAPLSLTDSRGVPLGYSRADRNSEFEAGQIFERYDADRSGALSLDEFLRFFADFQPQLAAFVQDGGPYLGAPGVPVAPAAPHEQTASSKQPEVADGRPTLMPDQRQQPALMAEDGSADTSERSIARPEASVKRQYQAALWELHKLCKEELDGQRERLVLKMATLRSEATQLQHRGRLEDRDARKRTVRFMQLLDHQRTGYSDGGDVDLDGLRADEHHGAVQVSALYELLETDLDHIDEITRFLRRYHRRGTDVTLREMQQFLVRAPLAQEEAQHLAMKDYGDRDWRRPVRSASPSCLVAPPASPTTVSPQVSPRPTTGNASPSRSQREDDSEAAGAHSQPRQSHQQRELTELLRVKDQMIYQLLQERAAMRKDKAATEAYLRTLSRVSSQEMKKWAQLTDEMQGEIERLREQLTPGRRSVPFR